MKLNLFAVVAVLAVGVIAAGCGSSNDNGDSTTTAAISKTAFVTQGNQICKQGTDEINQAGKQLGKNVSRAQINDFAANTIVPNVQKQVDGVKALGAPAGEEAQVNKLISVTEADLDQLKSDPAKIHDDHLFDDSNQAAKAVGLTECAG
jgi:maltose-binding protein MalE